MGSYLAIIIILITTPAFSFPDEIKKDEEPTIQKKVVGSDVNSDKIYMSTSLSESSALTPSSLIFQPFLPSKVQLALKKREEKEKSVSKKLLLPRLFSNSKNLSKRNSSSKEMPISLPVMPKEPQFQEEVSLTPSSLERHSVGGHDVSSQAKHDAKKSLVYHEGDSAINRSVDIINALKKIHKKEGIVREVQKDIHQPRGSNTKLLPQLVTPKVEIPNAKKSVVPSVVKKSAVGTPTGEELPIPSPARPNEPQFQEGVRLTPSSIQ